MTDDEVTAAPPSFRRRSPACRRGDGSCGRWSGGLHLVGSGALCLLSLQGSRWRLLLSAAPVGRCLPIVFTRSGTHINFAICIILFPENISRLTGRAVKVVPSVDMSMGA